MLNNQASYQNVLIENIIIDKEFKISKNIVDDKIIKSVQAVGILKPIVLLKTDNQKYIIVSGHNRIKITQQSNISEVKAIIYNELSYEVFKDIVLEKCFNNEIGPIGKIKSFKILKRINESNIENIAKNILYIPDYLYTNEKTINNLLDLPEKLKDYLDFKNIPFKVISNILQLPEEGIDLLLNWLKVILIKVNYFKDIVQYLLEIYKRDLNLNELQKIKLIDEDAKKNENLLYKKILQIRFPEFTELKTRAENITKKIKKPGLNINIPMNFESNVVKITFDINKKDNGKSFFDNIENLNKEQVVNLLELL